LKNIPQKTALKIKLHLHIIRNRLVPLVPAHPENPPSASPARHLFIYSASFKG
jgi:hypothetical protein